MKHEKKNTMFLDTMKKKLKISFNSNAAGKVFFNEFTFCTEPIQENICPTVLNSKNKIKYLFSQVLYQIGCTLFSMLVFILMTLSGCSFFKVFPCSIVLGRKPLNLLISLSRVLDAYPDVL